MRHSTQRLLSMGTGGLLVWAALVTVPLQAVAGGGGPSGWNSFRLPPTSTVPTPVKDTIATACQTQCQAMAADIDALNRRLKAALVLHDAEQMRAALHEVVQQQAAMQGRLAMCVQMTSLMSPMHNSIPGPGQGQ